MSSYKDEFVDEGTNKKGDKEEDVEVLKADSF